MAVVQNFFHEQSSNVTNLKWKISFLFHTRARENMYGPKTSFCR